MQPVLELSTAATAASEPACCDGRRVMCVVWSGARWWLSGVVGALCLEE